MGQKIADKEQELKDKLAEEYAQFLAYPTGPNQVNVQAAMNDLREFTAKVGDLLG